jgi:hypothetical protein
MRMDLPVEGGYMDWHLVRIVVIDVLFYSNLAAILE